VQPLGELVRMLAQEQTLLQGIKLRSKFMFIKLKMKAATLDVSDISERSWYWY